MPDAVEAKRGMDTDFERPSGMGGVKRAGLNEADVHGFVRDLRAGFSWDEVVEARGGMIAPAALEGWRAELIRRAAEPVNRGVTLPAPVAAAPVAAQALEAKPARRKPGPKPKAKVVQ
jgi:hypothetical protein